MKGETIKEFLVALGFDVSPEEVRKYDDFISGATKKMTGFAEVAVEAGLAIQASVTLIADQFEKLYYVSQRAETSVRAIQALQYGAAQVGVSAEAATQALQTMVRTMQLQPGLPGLMTRLGVDPSQKDKTEQMLQLVERLSKMPAYMGSAYARMFGIDDHTFQMLSLNVGQLREAEERQKKYARDAGVNPDKLSADSREFMNTTRDLQMLLTLFSMQIESSLLPVVKMFVELLGKVEHGAASLNRWAKDSVPGGGFLPAAEGIGGALGTAWGVRKLWRLVTGAGGTVAGGAGLAADAWGTARVTGFAGGTAAVEATTQTSLLGRILLALEGLAPATGAAVAGVITPLLMIGGGVLAYEGLSTVWKNRYSHASITENAAGAMNQHLLHSGDPRVSRHNPGNLKDVHGNMRSFASDEEGFRAMADQLLIDYHKHGQHTIAELIGGNNEHPGWTQPDEVASKGLIPKMSKYLGVGAGQQLNLTDAATLAWVMRGIAQQEVGNRDAKGNLYDFGMISKSAAEAEAQRNMGRSVTVHQSNETHISGVPDAPAVRREVDASHVLALRNMRGALNQP